jgi:hypothetical protein
MGRTPRRPRTRIADLELFERIERLEELVIRLEREAQLQFQRTAQIQVVLDEIQTAWSKVKRPRVRRDAEARPPG